MISLLSNSDNTPYEYYYVVRYMPQNQLTSCLLLTGIMTMMHTLMHND